MKRFITIIVALAFLISTSIGCQNSKSGNAPRSASENVESEKSAAGLSEESKKMDEEKFVDIAAKQSLLLNYYRSKIMGVKDSSSKEQLKKDAQKRIYKIYEKHGVTESQFRSYGEKIKKDSTKMKEITTRIMKRVGELRKDSTLSLE